MHKIALAFIAAAAVSSAAVAQDYRIAFGDLDLGSTRGAAAFDQRVGAAARRACLRSGSPMLDVRCAARFRDEAMRQLPAAAREDYVRTRSGRILAQVPVIHG